MQRITNIETINNIGQEVKVAGWVSARRDHGKICFLDLRDRTATLQVFCTADLVDKDIREESVVEIIGLVQARPEKLVNAESETGAIELQAKSVNILSNAQILPFEIKNMNVSLPTLFDGRPLSLRNEQVSAIFKTQEELIDGFRKTLKDLDFTEFQAPAIVGTAPEGGAEIFKIDYYDYNAYLAQSPQVYKQIMVGVYERVFTVAKAYRAEPSMTSRHLSEYISLDAEMGFIESWEDIMDACEKTIKGMLANVQEKYLKIHNAQIPDLSVKIPRIKLTEAQEMIGTDIGEPDLSPEGERKLCQWAKEKYNSDFVFVTHFPTKKRPFYTYPDPENPEYTLSFDLLFRGLEIVTGGQRINDYNQLLENIKKWGNSPKLFEFYLQAFKFGMPPEGGFAIGTERVTKQLLGIENVAQASLFPRDMERIDQRLSSIQERKNKK
jgi:nondiscriminating aspartyl-tRNA synthetase